MLSGRWPQLKIDTGVLRPIGSGKRIVKIEEGGIHVLRVDEGVKIEVVHILVIAVAHGIHPGLQGRQSGVN